MEHEPIKCQDDEFEDGEVNVCVAHFNAKLKREKMSAIPDKTEN